MSENLSDTENDERPENGAHNEREEDRLANRPFLLCRAKRCEIGAGFRGSHDGLHPLEGVTSEAPVPMIFGF